MLELAPRVPASFPAQQRENPRLADTRLGSFPGLSPADQEALGELILSSRTLLSGADLFHEGDPVDGLYFLVDGWACRYKTTRDGRRQMPALLIPGDACNLDSWIFERIDYGVRMLTPGTVLFLSRDRLLAHLADHPATVRALAWAGAVENAILSQWALCLGRQSARERLAHLLCELSSRLDPAGEQESVSFLFPLTQEHLADVLGLTPVHINRTMQQLRAEGLLVTQGRAVAIPDVRALRRVGDFDPRYLHDVRRPAAELRVVAG